MRTGGTILPVLEGLFTMKDLLWIVKQSRCCSNLSRWSPHQYVFEFGLADEIPLNLSQNAFSRRLQPLGFNMFDMLVVDLLHEFELGVWKHLFIHLLRILACVNPGLLHELDRRYVEIVLQSSSAHYRYPDSGLFLHLGAILFVNSGQTFPK